MMQNIMPEAYMERGLDMKKMAYYGSSDDNLYYGGN